LVGSGSSEVVPLSTLVKRAMSSAARDVAIPTEPARVVQLPVASVTVDGTGLAVGLRHEVLGAIAGLMVYAGLRIAIVPRLEVGLVCCHLGQHGKAIRDDRVVRRICSGPVRHRTGPAIRKAIVTCSFGGERAANSSDRSAMG